MSLDRYFGLSGKGLLMTGATGGIGTAMAQAFAAAGARLVLGGNDPDALNNVAAALPDARAIVCDVADPAALDRLAGAAQSHLGRIDVLVCNAGIPGPAAGLHEIAEIDRDDLLRINLHHPLHLASRVAPRMAECGGGSIVLTASIAGLRGNARIGLYGMTKAALMQLARNLAVEWGPSGVRANAIAPGLIDTSWAQAILSDAAAARRRLDATPLRRIGTPWEVAAAALFLAGPGAGFITGQTLVVDGGTLISDGN